MFPNDSCTANGSLLYKMEIPFLVHPTENKSFKTILLIAETIKIAQDYFNNWSRFPLPCYLNKRLHSLPFSIFLSSKKGMLYISLPIKISSGTVSRVSLLFGVFFKNAEEKPAIQFYAKISSSLENHRRDQILQEAQMLSQLKGCSGIIPMHDSIVYTNYYGHKKQTMIQDFADGDLLTQCYQINNHLQLITICLDIARGLQEIHFIGIIHNDIKLENILTSKENRAFITDFNASFFSNNAARFLVGTFAYFSPEKIEHIVNRGKKYDEKADMWAFGCLIYVLLYKKFPPWILPLECISNILLSKYEKADEKMECIQQNVELFLKIHKEFFELHHSATPAPSLEHLMFSLLHADPEKRPSATETVIYLENLFRHISVC